MDPLSYPVSRYANHYKTLPSVIPSTSQRTVVGSLYSILQLFPSRACIQKSISVQLYYFPVLYQESESTGEEWGVRKTAFFL